MSNTGTSVTGFAVEQHELAKTMKMFDGLPASVRSALNDARAEWSVKYFKDWIPMMGPATVCRMITQSDDEWARTGYLDRGFTADDIKALLAADKRRAA